MTDTQSDRFIELTKALQYDSYGEKYLTDFDRMFIQQERSALLNNRPYKLADYVEEKIEIKLNYINKYNWECPY
ncbi:hypothetical protein [Epilithonimonas xixisoli]|uniref:Uncharacterized protein n=1 Tax=Epilithonimonas xixisoli TaxID=1476462 RepID=A0A4R8IH91_9FLAO|nr:hypothetical protein [Epilithonimonas xixisoli]TDX86213.1 hypothetical protein B0I22_0323 [Epilithonimonas xixisoli]